MRRPNPVTLRAALWGACCLSMCFLAVPDAFAGRLGKVTKQISNQTSSSKGRSGGGGGESKNDPRSGKSNTTVDVEVNGCASCAPVVTASAAAPAGAQSQNHKSAVPTRPEFDLYVGAHRVVESDGALAGSVRIRHSGFAIELSDTSYFERRPTLTNEDDRIRMDVWSINFQGRALAVDRIQLWVVGGFGAAGSTEFERLQGPMVGARMNYWLSPGLEMELGGRYLGLEKDVSATELRASIRASVLTVGYRRLAFDVGPPLHGPEVGVTLTF